MCGDSIDRICKVTASGAFMQAGVGPGASQHRPLGAASRILERHHWSVRCAYARRLVHLDLRGLGSHYAGWHCADCIQPHSACEASSS